MVEGMEGKMGEDEAGGVFDNRVLTPQHVCLEMST